jgi:hypothetical protein
VPSIGVVDATGVAPSSLPVGPAQAYRVAVKAFAWQARPTASVQLSGRKLKEDVVDART